MSATHTLGPHLPYLRRYARALTGSQTSGDAFVRASLEAFLEGNAELTKDVPPRVIVVGSPAHVLRDVDPAELRENGG